MQQPSQRSYQMVAIASLFFALIGFSYNAWRLEISEDNSNIRAASFQVLLELSELEQLVFAAHYDNDPVAGNPRTGWVKVGIINDLSMLVSPAGQREAAALKTIWSENWEQMSTDRQATERIVAAIDSLRTAVKQALGNLQ